MVRFSDIKGIREKESAKDKPEDKAAEKEEIRLSDTQMLGLGESTSAFEVQDLQEVNPEVAAYYEKFVKRAIEISDRAKNNQGISPSPILSDLHHIIKNDLIDPLFEYAMSVKHGYDDSIVHNIEVTFASLKLGKGRGYDTKKLLKLGLAAFFQNLGMCEIPQEILKKKGKLNGKEVKMVRSHPEVCARMLSQLGERYKWLQEIVLQVHERSDGSGYPRGLRGPEISEMASIIGLCDTFLAMIKKRPYRDKIMRPDAVRFIIREAKGQFPPGILKVFLNQISLFPINTYVRLNNKSIGRVVSTDRNQPLRPTVELLYDGQGRRLKEKEIVKLSEHPLLHIVETVDEEALS